GYESWENVWGIWNGFTPRDAEALRRMATIERGMADLLTSPDWEPHVETLQKGVYASRFTDEDRTLWLLVNRTDKNIDGDQLTLPKGGKFFDLYHGVPIASGSFEVEAHGYGATLQLKEGQPDEKLTKLLATMQDLTKKPL